MLSKLYKFFLKTSTSEKKIILKDVLLNNEDENITRVCSLIKKVKIKGADSKLIVDIGAYTGETAASFSKAFPANKIVAFEANPKMHEVALKKHGTSKNIQFLNTAISDKSEVLNFYVTSNDVSSSLNNINSNEVNSEDYKTDLNVKTVLAINAESLDSKFKNENILLLKIDTQGHELKVLAGAKETLKRTDFILVEMGNHNMYVSGCKYYEVDEVMRENNFKLLDIIVTYRKRGIILSEFDAIYVNAKTELN
jgi:FkbM family methyltransferase